MNDLTIAEARREAERFLMRLDELKACRKPQTEAEKAQRWGRPRFPHSGSCPETAATRRASMDLTRALAKLRRY